MPSTPLVDAALSVAAAWLVVGLLGLVRPRATRWVAHVLFPLGACGSVAMAGIGLAGLFVPAQDAVLALGLPGLASHWRLDALSGFFLFLLGASSLGSSLFAAGYFRAGQGTTPGQLGLLYHLFLGAMALVLLAADAYSFMLAWEAMAVSSYLLVLTRHDQEPIRAAGYLYVLVAHLGALALVLAWALLARGSLQGMDFASMRAAVPDPQLANIVFALALLGFGAKAGLVPLHAWLPEAHPAAPSPVSALMSAVMLKTALYGLLRVGLDLLHGPAWWWGGVLLALGLFSALFGVLMAAVQTDMKRLLAYSSIENIGIACAALGLVLVLRAAGMASLAALALAALLVQLLNHALFKNLLFLATGSVLHATGQRALGRLGGLLRRMPWVGWTALVGALAMAGLPPLGGFVAEWMLLQAFLQTPLLPTPYFGMFIGMGAALLVLVAALAAYVMVKFYGVIFLGRPREPGLELAHDPGWLERAGLVWLSVACLALGLLPGLVLAMLQPVQTLLLGQALGAQPGWTWVVPVAAERAAYNPMAVLLVAASMIVLAVLGVLWLRVGAVRRAPAWACGDVAPGPRMQDSAEGFGQPIRRLFEPFFVSHVELPAPDAALPRYRVDVADRFLAQIYVPLAKGLQNVTRQVARMQQGSIALYLFYAFATLLGLLWAVLG